MRPEPIRTKRLVLRSFAPDDAPRLERLGMSQEGHLRERVRKGKVFEDVLLWATVCSTRVDVGS
jgi:hypothetical protein